MPCSMPDWLPSMQSMQLFSINSLPLSKCLAAALSMFLFGGPVRVPVCALAARNRTSITEQDGTRCRMQHKFVSPFNLRQKGHRSGPKLNRSNLFLQHLECALQPDAARRLQQDGISGTHLLGQPLTGLLGCFHKLRLDPGAASSFSESLGQAAYTNDYIDLLFCGVTSDLAMQSFGRGAELQHLSCHEDAATGLHAGQCIDHGLEGAGVGIVAIINNGGAAAVEHLPTLVAGNHGGQGLYRFRGRDTALHGSGRRSQRIIDVMFADQR